MEWLGICGEHGNDIAYAGNNCPVCDVISDLESEHETNITELEDRVEELQSVINDLEDTIKVLEEREV